MRLQMHYVRSLKKFLNYLLAAVLQAMLAVCMGRSLKEKLSNYLLVAVLQAMLAVCRGRKMILMKITCLCDCGQVIFAIAYIFCWLYI